MTTATAVTGPATERAATAGPPTDPDILLDVRDLRTHFHVMDGVVKAVDGVTFQLRRGQTLGVVGESGCGKSVTAMTIMRLLDMPPARIPSGEIWFGGQDLVGLEEDRMRKLRMRNRLSRCLRCGEDRQIARSLAPSTSRQIRQWSAVGCEHLDAQWPAMFSRR